MRPNQLIAKISVVLCAISVLGGCAQGNIRPSGIRPYGAAQLPPRPVLSPSAFSTQMSVTFDGQSFEYRDGAGVDRDKREVNSDQLFSSLTSGGFSPSQRLEINNSEPNKVLRFEKLLRGKFAFQCNGECSNVQIHIQGNCSASLAMQSYFPTVSFRAPTLWGSSIKLRIANPEALIGKNFSLSVTLWQ